MACLDTSKWKDSPSDYTYLNQKIGTTTRAETLQRNGNMYAQSSNFRNPEEQINSNGLEVPFMSLSEVEKTTIVKQFMQYGELPPQYRNGESGKAFLKYVADKMNGNSGVNEPVHTKSIDKDYQKQQNMLRIRELKFNAGYTHKQIAEVLGISAGTVSNYLKEMGY